MKIDVAVLPVTIQIFFLEKSVKTLHHHIHSTTSYLVDVEDAEHVVESFLLDGVRLAVLVAEESTAQHSEIHRRHQTVPKASNNVSTVIITMHVAAKKINNRIINKDGKIDY